MSPEAMEVLDGIEPMIAINVGPVLSSKTELALYFAQRYLKRSISVVFVKPSWDIRFGDPAIVRSRSEMIPEIPGLPTVVVPCGEEHTIPGLVEGYEVPIIDEAQRFRPCLATYVRAMFLRGQRVIANVLNFTWELREFATTAALLSIPERTEFRKSGFCLLNGCKHSAPISQKLLSNGQPARIFSGEPVDDPGGSEKYLPRCWRHWLETTPGAKEELASQNCRFFRVDPATTWETMP